MSDDGDSYPGEKSVPGSRHFLGLKATLGLDEFKDKAELKRRKRRRQKERKRLKKEEEKLEVVEAGGSKPEVVVYKSSRRRRDGDEEEEPEDIPDKPDLRPAVDLSQARSDVYRLGVSGLDRAGQLDARVSLALRLGARPEKRKCVGYEQYKAELRRRRDEEASRKLADKAAGMKKVAARPASAKAGKKNHPGVKGKKNARRAGAERTALKMGKFDGGTLRLSKRDVAKMRG